MSTPPSIRLLSRRPAAAFTLVEMMVTVALLGFIVVGLTTMFVQAQRAFRAGMNQTDVLESGRAMADLVTHQLEEATPTHLSGVTNFGVDFRAWSTNALTGSTAGRTNILDSFYFFTRNNLTTTLNGYVVAQPGASLTATGTACFGTLYYFQTSITNATTNSLYGTVAAFANIAGNAVNNRTVNGNANNIDSNLVRVADGIVHFRILPYNTNGVLILTNYNSVSPLLGAIRVSTNVAPLAGEIYGCTFLSNAIPASVDLELGVLESSTLAKLQALPSTGPAPTPQQSYLTRSQTAGRIHIFRRHVVLSGVDPQAYQ